MPKLEGITVLDLTQFLPGPMMSVMMADQGAEVIKVERPDGGDHTRRVSTRRNGVTAAGLSTAYVTQGAGKQSVAVDVSRPEGRQVFERLLETADVLVENHRPDTLARLRLTEDETLAINPRLVHCALTGYGRDNDMAAAPAYDVHIQAISGLMALTGTQETGPVRTGAPIVDYATGLAAALATLAALMQRDKSGTGQFVDVSMLDTAFSLMSSTITDLRLTGTVPQPRGNAANSRSPSAGVFACAEGHISLGVNEEHQFRALAYALDRADWLDDPRFANRVSRADNRAALAQALADILATRDADTWERRLIAAGVPCAKLRTLPEALSLPPAQQRNFTTRGAAGYCGLPFRLAAAPDVTDAAAPALLGADTRAVLGALGYSVLEIEAMVGAGLVASPD